MIIAREFRFEAAHFLPGHPKCGRMHGHSYRLVVAVEGPVGENGMVMDFSELEDLVREAVLDKVDHKPLNDGPRTMQPPTVENLIRVFAGWLDPLWKARGTFHLLPRLHHLELYETADSSAIWFPSLPTLSEGSTSQKVVCPKCGELIKIWSRV